MRFCPQNFAPPPRVGSVDNLGHPRLKPHIHPALPHVPDGIGEALDEIAVVHHRQDRAVELAQGLLELRAAGDIQVVDRLIQQQAVALARHQQRQHQPGALAVAQQGDRA